MRPLSSSFALTSRRSSVVSPLVLLALGLGVVVVDGFSTIFGSHRGGGFRSTTTTTTRSRSTGGGARYMIFERMSEQCIAALITAQNEASRLGRDEVGPELMTVGIVDSPENARRTLQSYGITFRKVKRTAADMFPESSSSSSDESDNAFAGMFARQRKARNAELPFTRELKRALTGADRVANRLESAEIRSEHVLLSLLRYAEDAETGRVTAAEVDPETDSADGALAVFLLTEGVDAESFSASEFCRKLLIDVEDGGDGDDDGRELVGGGRRGGAEATPTLSECGVDLTEKARNNGLDRVHGRDEEITSALRTLVRRRKNNPCLIGEPGVGKTAIAEGVAQILAAPSMLAAARNTMDRDEDGNVVDADTYRYLQANAARCPPRLAGHRVVSLELASLVAGTKYRGEFEERLQNIVKELTDPAAPPTVLFLDEIHSLVGAGSAEGGIDAANMLKPALARGELQVIGATTIAEYRKHIEKDAALERRLQPLTVKEPTTERALDILRNIVADYAAHHDVDYDDDALEACVRLSERYVTDRFLPDKAIDLLDEAGAARSLERGLDDGDGRKARRPAVTADDVAAVVSRWTDVPVGRLELEEASRLVDLESELERRVKGQPRAVRSAARAVRRARAGLRDPARPAASLLFAGPTGVGKTELCRALAESHFGSEKNMVRVDMSEYVEKHTVARLVGPPPGYIGYEEGGQLTEAVRRAPHSVVLLDEIEKGHPDVLNVLLQIMEDGILTDGKGRTVNFKNVVLVMTSNVGSQRILEVARKRESDTTIAPVATTTTTTTSAPPAFSSNAEPPRPDEILDKLRASPEAMALMMEASRDPDIMDAMQTAMGGSPADLMRVAQRDPKVADFLTRLWAALGMAGDDDAVVVEPTNGAAVSAPPDDDPIQSGLRSVRESLESWTADNDFASGLVDQLKTMLPSDDEDDDQAVQETVVNGNVPDAAATTVSDDVAADYFEMSDVVKEELQSTFRPELLNRIDEIIVFSPLGHENLVAIASSLAARTTDRARDEKGVVVDLGPRLLARIVAEGSTDAATYGARPMRRAVRRLYEDAVGEAVVRGLLREGDEATAETSEDDDDVVVVTRRRDGATTTVAVDDADAGVGTARRSRRDARPPTPTRPRADAARA